MSKYFPLKADGFSQRIYCANGEVFANLPYCGDPQEQASRARMIVALPDLLQAIQAAEDALMHAGCKLHASRCRDTLAIALGAPATNPEAASAFAEMMGSPAFPSIKGEQK